MKHRQLSALLLASTLALLQADPAQACSCALESTDLLAPADGEAGVPLNARIWVGAAHYDGQLDDAAGQLALLDDSGTPVSVTVTELFGNNERIGVLTPEQPLQAEATYSIQAGGEEILGQFVVGDAEDTVAPDVPAELDRSSSASARTPGMESSCGPTDVVVLDVEATGLLLVASLQDGEAPDVDAVDGEAAELSMDGELTVGSAGCVWSWPEAAPNSSAAVRWGAFDLAGNFSGWSAAEQVSIPPAGCSCSAAGSSPAGGAALALLALVAAGLRRRRLAGLR